MIGRLTPRFLGLVALCLFAVGTASGQRKAPTVDDLLSVNGAQGREFWIAIPPNEINPYQVSALEIYIASAFDTEITVFDASGDRTYRRRINAGEIRTLSDSRGETNWTWEVREYEQPVRKGIRITADKPISVYVLNGKRFSSDGFLAIPTSVWGKEYISTSFYDFNEFDNWAGGFVVIAREDNTVVDIWLRGEGQADATTSGGKRIGDRFTVNLQEGDVYAIKGDGQTRGIFDVTGSSIRANKPIGLMSYHQRSTIPNILINGNGRDHLVEMTPPVETWGKKYVTVEYNREGSNPNAKGDLFRVIAAEDNTRWSLKYFDKTSKTLLGQGGGVLARAGDFATLSQSQGPTVLTHGFSVWEADKPIFVMQYSCSANFDGDQKHDPFMINVVPEEQFIPNTIFQTPTDTKFLEHNLNLIVWADTADPDYVDNLRSLEIDDIPVWNHPQSVSPTLLFNHMGDNLHWVTIDFGTEAIAHRIKGNGKVKFGGYIYGFGQVDSYGWPAASGFRPTSILDTMPPELTADTLCGDFQYTATEFRNIPDPPRNPPGDSDQVETGISQIEFNPEANNFNYRIVLQSAQEFPRDPSFKEFQFLLEVIDKSQDAYAEIIVTDYADNFTLDTVFYFADDLRFEPDPLAFGEIRLGTTKQLDVTVTNDSDGEVTLTESTMQTGDYYAIVGGILPPEMVLAPGETHTFTIEYRGDRETADVESDFDIDTLIVNTDCGEFKIGIDGVASLPCIVVEDFDAGIVGVGEEKCKAGGLRIQNPGSDTLVITNIAGYGGTNFTLSNPSDPALPIVILPGGEVFLKEVCYQRGDVGVDSIDVVFTSNADGAPDLVECDEYDNISTWTGEANAPGPRIVGYNWLKRRVNTLHEEFGEVRVWNTGNRVITLTDVTFADGTKYFPAGTGEADYVFKLGRILVNGQPVTDVQLSTLGTTEAFIEAWFRPAAEQIYSADIIPVWAEGDLEPVQDRLEGEGILPQIETVGSFLTCDATPEGQTVVTNLAITNNSTTEDLTVSNLRLEAGADPAWAFNPAPANPIIVPQGQTVNVPLEFTRPIGNNLGFNLNVEFEHDAVTGNGQDPTVTPIAGTETFGVGSCSGPDIQVTDIDYGRQLANCDEPQLDFTITNTGGGNIPLEIREITPVGANAGAYTVVNIIGPGGVTVATPFTIPAGETATVTVRFSPTLPDAAPWADQNYDALIRIENYVEGAQDELRPDTFVEVRGTGFVIPVNFALTNSTNGDIINPGDDNGNASRITFTVSAVSANWQRAGLTDYIADVVYETEAIAIDVNSLAINNGWQLASPVEITDVDGVRSQARFILTSGANGGPLTGDGPVFSFQANLLLGQNFASDQDLTVDLLRACLVPGATGTSTEITNCALTKRVISISGTQFSFQPVTPNPISNGIGTVNFGVGIDAPTTIEVINAQGQIVSKLVDQPLTTGEYTLQFPTTNLGNGVYFIRMTSADYTKTQQVIVGD